MSCFITFEGGEGSGKTSHLKSIISALRREKIPYIKSYEPGGTEIGDAIRNLLLDTKNTHMNPQTELLLYLASRKQHLEELIKPSLAEGKLVICDRFEDSSLIYQGYTRGLGIQEVKKLSRMAGIDLKPHLTILFDVPAEIGLERARGRSLEGVTRFENEKMEFHRKVRTGFLQLAKEEPERFAIVDTTRDFHEVETELLDLLFNTIRKCQ